MNLGMGLSRAISQATAIPSRILLFYAAQSYAAQSEFERVGGTRPRIPLSLHMLWCKRDRGECSDPEGDSAGR